MKQINLLVLVLLAICVLSAPLFAGDHWVVKPCGDGSKGACFMPLASPYFKRHPIDDALADLYQQACGSGNGSPVSLTTSADRSAQR